VDADIAGALAFWQNVVGVGADRFAKPTLKRHNPKTVRRKIGDDYHGCLCIDVRRSARLLLRIEGWVIGACGGPDGGG
jgi:hypothetical protein